jgi:hypothetical protein
MAVRRRPRTAGGTPAHLRQRQDDHRAARPPHRSLRSPWGSNPWRRNGSPSIPATRARASRPASELGSNAGPRRLRKPERCAASGQLPSRQRGPPRTPIRAPDRTPIDRAMRALLVIRRENGPRDRFLFLLILQDVRRQPGRLPRRYPARHARRPPLIPHRGPHALAAPPAVKPRRIGQCRRAYNWQRVVGRKAVGLAFLFHKL